MNIKELVEAWPLGHAPISGGKMKFRVLDGFCLGAPQGDVHPGDVVELTEREAAIYIRQGRLAPHTEEPKPASTEVAAPEGMSIEAQNQDPKPARRGK